MPPASEVRRIALSFMAHPDDAEFTCAGTLMRLAEQGWEIHIASLTPGDCGTTTETPWDIASRRTQEARRAAALLGAEYHCLDERDGFVVYDKPTLRKAVDLFRRIGPGIVFTHALRDYMMDHEMVAALARAAAFLFAAPNASAFPVPPDAGVPYLYYCDPPEGLDPYGEPIRPTTVVDIGSYLERKAEMLACHASQREWLLAHHGIDEYVDSMQRHAVARGAQFGVRAAEAFVQHRGHAFPRNDLLADLFPLGNDSPQDRDSRSE
ncbi:MAG: PIG-L family deacetylase [Planctomycetota bacterium]|nr:MAG: PIG-L family deacetylase [Planctomycetota bacterium]